MPTSNTRNVSSDLTLKIGYCTCHFSTQLDSRFFNALAVILKHPVLRVPFVRVFSTPSSRAPALAQGNGHRFSPVQN
ncbi:hypothetical protein TPS_03937 [Trichinella pseudospiralis]